MHFYLASYPETLFILKTHTYLLWQTSDQDEIPHNVAFHQHCWAYQVCLKAIYRSAVVSNRVILCKATLSLLTKIAGCNC